MTDDLILAALTRLETKLDDVRQGLGATRESMATLRARGEETSRQVAVLAESCRTNDERISGLESFRTWLIGAGATGGAIGGVVASIVFWFLG